MHMRPRWREPISPYLPGEIDNTVNDPRHRAPLVTGDSASFHAITEKICYVAEAPRPPKAWYIGFARRVHVFEYPRRDDPLPVFHGRGRVGR